MKIIGIDTDTKGSIALLDTSTNRLCIFATPNQFKIINKKKRMRLHEEGLLRILSNLMPDADHVYLEQQNARPAQGAASIFTFGMVYGTYIGMVHLLAYIHDVEVHYVTGAKWKNSLGLTKDKKLTVDFATKCAPNVSHAWRLVKHTSAAEAFLIALYGVGSLGVRLKKVQITPVPMSFGDDLISLS